MKTTMKRALAVTGIAAAGITGASAASAYTYTSSGWASGNVHNGISCHGNNPFCSIASGEVTKTGNGVVNVDVDVSTQRHDRNFTVYVTDGTVNVSTKFTMRANSGVSHFAVAGMPKGHRYTVDVAPWSDAPLDAGSGIYLRANG